MNDLEEDIAAAIAETTSSETPATPAVAEATPEAPAVETAPPEVQETEAEAAARARDEKGRFAAKEKTATPAPVAAKPTVTVKPTLVPAKQTSTPAPVPGAVTPMPAETFKAPQSWKPAAREHFAKLPPEVQAEVSRREKEAYAREQETAPMRQFAQHVHSIIGPHEALFRSEGASPLEGVQSLVQTYAALRNGPPAQKAAILANLFKTSGASVEDFAAALDGAPATPQQEFRDPRFDQLMGALQQTAQQKQQANAQKRQAEIDGFAETHEFHHDVKEDMSDILIGAARRKVAMSLEEAYSRACRMNPEVWSVIQRQEQAKAATATTAATQQALSAASSIRSQPAGATHAPQSKTVEDDVREAMAALSGR